VGGKNERMRKILFFLIAELLHAADFFLIFVKMMYLCGLKI
jgi:hypothetical protein